MERRPLNKLSDVIFCVFALNTRLVPYLQMIYKKLVYIEHLRDTHIHTLIHRLLIIVWDRRRERPNPFEWEYGFSIKGGTNVCLSLFIAVLYTSRAKHYLYGILCKVNHRWNNNNKKQRQFRIHYDALNSI